MKFLNVENIPLDAPPGVSMRKRAGFVDIEIARELRPSWLKKDERLFLPAAELLNFRQLIESVLLEQYRVSKRPVVSYLPFDYHAVPEMARAAAARVLLAGKGNPSRGGAAFPRFPCEKTLEALIYAIEKSRGAVQERGGFDVILSHDVDEKKSMSGVAGLREIERGAGVSSVWFIAGKVLEKAAAAARKLVESGCEIALHEVRHDYKFPWLSESGMARRIESVAKLSAEFEIKGFRSPFYLRSPDMFRFLARHFAWDSSVPDVDWFSPGPERGGCALVRPFLMPGGLLELPVTLPFEIPYISGAAPGSLLEFWREKIEFVRDAGGLLMVNTHPDVHASGNREMRAAYSRLIEMLRGMDARFILPRKISGG